MCRLGVFVGVLTMFVSRRSMLFRLVVVAVIVMMGSLHVVVSRNLMMRSGVVVMLAGGVLLFLGHIETPLKNEVHEVAVQNAPPGVHHGLSRFRRPCGWVVQPNS
jgi:hypothetical protein